MIGAPPELVAAATTWTLNVERAARPGETTQQGAPAAFVGVTVAHLPRFLLDLPPAALAAYFEPLQRRVRERLGCPPRSRGPRVLNPRDIPAGWSFIVCPHCLGALAVPPDQTDAEQVDQLADHIRICTAEQPPLPRAAPPPSTELGRCTSSLMPDGGHCPCWREGRGEPCCSCGWQSWDDGLAPT